VLLTLDVAFWRAVGAWARLDPALLSRGVVQGSTSLLKIAVRFPLTSSPLLHKGF